MSATGVKVPTPPSTLGTLKPSIVAEEQEQQEPAQNVTTSEEQQCLVAPLTASTPSDSLALPSAHSTEGNANDDILKPNRTPVSAHNRYRESHPTLFSSPPLAPMSSFCNDLDDLDDLDDFSLDGG